MNQFQRSLVFLSRRTRLSNFDGVSGTIIGPQYSLGRHMSNTMRRKRKKYEKYTSIKLNSELPGQSSGLETPFQYSGENLEEYTEMATLSPWTPVPDSVARKIFDRADIQEGDVSRQTRLISMVAVSIC